MFEVVLTGWMLLVAFLLLALVVERDEIGRHLRIAWRRWRLRRQSDMSARWFKEQDQQMSRVEYHGPTIAFPIRKEDSIH